MNTAIIRIIRCIQDISYFIFATPADILKIAVVNFCKRKSHVAFIRRIYFFELMKKETIFNMSIKV